MLTRYIQLQFAFAGVDRRTGSRCCRPIFATMLKLGMVLSIAISLPESVQADILWQGPQNISSDLDVSTSGDLLRAWGGATSTVNGVTFTSGAGFAPISAQSGGALFGGTSTIFNSLSPAYQTLLDSAVFNAAGFGFENTPGRMAINLTGLTVGQLYEFQAFVNDSRNATSFGGGAVNFGRSNVFDSGAGSSQSQSVFQPLNAGDSNIGQYIKGTFTATSNTQLVRIHGDALIGPKTSLINAYQLRDITAVPEPSSILLFSSAAGLGGMFLRKRLRKLKRKPWPI